MEFTNRVKRAVDSVEREARLAKQRAEAEQAMAERKQADEAFRANYERLKAERLAREGKNSRPLRSTIERVLTDERAP
jgi:hypothetical protein